MTLKARSTWGLITFLLIGAPTASAGMEEVLIQVADVRLIRPSDGATVVELTLPEGIEGNGIAFATLEFYVAATAADGSARPYAIRFSPVVNASEAEIITADGHWPGEIVDSGGTVHRAVLDVTTVLKNLGVRDGPRLAVWEVLGDDDAVEIGVQEGLLGEGVLGRLRVWTHP